MTRTTASTTKPTPGNDDTTDDTSARLDVLRCIDSFTTWNADGIPTSFSAGDEVLSDDPILTTHAAFFEPVAYRLTRARTEMSTAAPGERRGPITSSTSK